MLRPLRWRFRFFRRRLKNPTHRVLRARARHRRLTAHSRVRATPMCAGAQCDSARGCVWRAWVCTGDAFFFFTSLRTVGRATRDATHVPLRPSRTAVPTQRRCTREHGTAQRSTGRRSKARRRRGTATSGAKGTARAALGDARAYCASKSATSFAAELAAAALLVPAAGTAAEIEVLSGRSLGVVSDQSLELLEEEARTLAGSSGI